MTFENFVAKWDNKPIDFDGIYPNQCMDLMHQYLVEVLGLTDGAILAQPDAKSVYLNFDSVKGHELFDKIANTPTGVPDKGDIIFWGTGIGQYGHVAIMVQGDSNSFRSFDQNFPVGSVCHVQNHPDYVGVLGWLRLKPQKPMATITQEELDIIRKARDNNWDKFQASETENLKIKLQLETANNKLKEINTLASKFYWFYRSTFQKIKDLSA